jgi:hypothetical protein
LAKASTSRSSPEELEAIAIENATVPGRPNADVANFARVNKPENDDPSIVEPIEAATSA